MPVTAPSFLDKQQLEIRPAERNRSNRPGADRRPGIGHRRDSPGKWRELHRDPERQRRHDRDRSGRSLRSRHHGQCETGQHQHARLCRCGRQRSHRRLHCRRRRVRRNRASDRTLADRFRHRRCAPKPDPGAAPIVLGDIIASDDDWKDSQQTEIAATGLQPSKDLESAILATLAPGAYTAIVRGVSDTTGVGLVEVYDLN